MFSQCSASITAHVTCDMCRRNVGGIPAGPSIQVCNGCDHVSVDVREPASTLALLVVVGVGLQYSMMVYRGTSE